MGNSQLVHEGNLIAHISVVYYDRSSMRVVLRDDHYIITLFSTSGVCL